jgi:hypothetical protein
VSGAWRVAAFAYEKAEREAPGEDIYSSQLGFALLEQAKRQGPMDWQTRHRLFEESQTALFRAQRLNPANLEHTRNLAKLYSAWSNFDPNSERAQRHLAEAESLYRQLSEAMPRNAGLMNEWATRHQ